MHGRYFAAIASLALLASPAYGAVTSSDFETDLDLAGDAFHVGDASAVPDATFTYRLRADGTMTQTSGGGNGARLSGTLSGTIQIAYTDEESEVVVEEEAITLAIHGNRASFAAQGLDGFRLTLNQQGRAGNLQSFVVPGAFTAGVSEDEDGAKEYALASRGQAQATFKGTHHWKLDVVGTMTLADSS